VGSGQWTVGSENSRFRFIVHCPLPTKKMQIVINHLTRMHGGHICVAGIDVETRQHVRPVLGQEHLPFYFLASYGGPFEMARILDLGSPRPVPAPPHVEDHIYIASRVKVIRTASTGEFWQLLSEVSRPSLGEIFGEVLAPAGHCGLAAQSGCGAASLGCLRLQRPPELFLVPGRSAALRLRIRFDDGPRAVEASVTDLRLFAEDHANPAEAAIRAASHRLRDSGEIILSVGLTRRYQPAPDQPERHWLQVNNLHLAADPLWQLG
jgi:hypothetical protein